MRNRSTPEAVNDYSLFSNRWNNYTAFAMGMRIGLARVAASARGWQIRMPCGKLGSGMAMNYGRTFITQLPHRFAVTGLAISRAGRKAIMNSESEFRLWARQTIQAAGLRATPARVATLNLLRQSSTPLTHAEVSDRLTDQGIDKATIFRNLNDLAAAGLLRRSELGDHVWRFEIVGEGEHVHESHPHFVCVDCGNVSCLQQIRLTKKSQLASEAIGHVTEILLRGQCRDCVSP